MENRKQQNGDVLIIGGQPYMIIDHWDKGENGERGKFKHCLLALGGFYTDYWFEEPDFKIGDIVFGEETDDPEWPPMRVEAIIPKDKINIHYKLF